MPDTARRLIEVVSSQSGKDHDQSILGGWEYTPEEAKPPERQSERQGGTGITWGHARKVIATLSRNSHDFFRIVNATRGDRGTGDKPGLWELRGPPAWYWVRGKKYLHHRGGVAVYEHTPYTGWESSLPYEVDYQEDPGIDHPQNPSESHPNGPLPLSSDLYRVACWGFVVFCFDSLALSIKLCCSSSGRSER